MPEASFNHQNPTGLDIRQAEDSDVGGIIDLAVAALGWDKSPQTEAFFRWKHYENPAGHSPIWIATKQKTVVGLRAFLNWRFTTSDESVTRAVRAVDTATHPDFQGRGIFSRLTAGAIETLDASGIDFIFNTPNEKSRPGYLRMGWQVVGSVPVSMRPRNVSSFVRMSQSRTAANKWSLPNDDFDSAATILDSAAAKALVRSLRPSGINLATPGITTDRTHDFLVWRYGFKPLGYRALVAPEGIDHGFIIFRTRKRGHAIEAVIAEVLVPDSDRTRIGKLLIDILRKSKSDYLIAAGPRQPGLVSIPRLGPVLTWRAINTASSQPPLKDWHLSMGDIELF
ncbi:MAG: GNAT family N-acetyltransferase [Actinomycetes bacterium]